MESCLTWEIATLKLLDKTLQANLWQAILAIPDPDRPSQQLFHLVSKTFKDDRHIFRFHPSKSQHVRRVVTGLLVFLKGVWGNHMDTAKFNMFLNDGAIDRANDSWWDKESKTVVTKADVEMEKLANQDDDNYNFLEMKIVVELLKAKPTGKAGKAEDGLSTGLYSTFHTTAMQKQQKQQHSGKKVQIETPTITMTSDQPSVITMNTLTEQSFAQLVKSIVVAIQANHISTTQKNTKGASSGQKAGQPK